jgi:hypothetical protein
VGAFDKKKKKTEVKNLVQVYLSPFNQFQKLDISFNLVSGTPGAEYFTHTKF